MNHTSNCPIEISQKGSWYSKQKPYCNCNQAANSNPDNFQRILTPVNCQHDWRVDKTNVLLAKGIIVCSKCGQMENISQKEENKKAESGCTHQFKFSHQAQEARGTSGLYQIVMWKICVKCSLMKEQIL